MSWLGKIDLAWLAFGGENPGKLIGNPDQRNSDRDWEGLICAPGFWLVGCFEVVMKSLGI
jgi:hypothetical protein